MYIILHNGLQEQAHILSQAFSLYTSIFATVSVPCDKMGCILVFFSANCNLFLSIKICCEKNK